MRLEIISKYVKIDVWVNLIHLIRRWDALDLLQDVSATTPVFLIYYSSWGGERREVCPWGYFHLASKNLLGFDGALPLCTEIIFLKTFRNQNDPQCCLSEHRIYWPQVMSEMDDLHFKIVKKDHWGIWRTVVSALLRKGCTRIWHDTICIYSIHLAHSNISSTYANSQLM